MPELKIKYKICFSFLILFFLGYETLLAQTAYSRIENLKKELQNTNGIKKAEIFYSIGKLYIQMDSLKIGISYLKDAQINYEKSENTEKIIEIKCLLGESYMLLDDLINSFDNFYPGYLLSKRNSLLEKELFCAVGLSEFFFTFKDNDNARHYISESFRISKKLKTSRYDSKLNNLMGLVFMDEKKYDSSRFYFTKVIKSGYSIKDFNVYFNTLNNYNYLLLSLDSTEKALNNFKDVLKKFPNQLKPRSKVSIFSNIGGCYLKLNDLKKAKDNYYLSLNLSQLHDFNIINAHNCKRLAEIYKREKNIDSALYFHNLYFNYHEELYNLEKLNKIHDLIKKLEDDKILSQNEIYRNTLKIRKLELFISVFAVILLLFLIFNLRSFYRKRIRAKEKQNSIMQDTISSKSRELVSLSLNLDEKNILLSNLNKTVKTAKNSTQKKQLKNAIDDIDSKLLVNSYLQLNRDNFLLHFSNVHPAFFDNILKVHPELTRTELRHCAYIKMNLATKEIAIMNSVSNNTVQMTRYRLKKKLGLSENDSLTAYINRF